MTEYYSKLKLKERRRELRHTMTKAEAKLWTHIRKKQVSEQRFLRQFSIGSYIVDFFCPHLNLAVEIDGATHVTDEEIAYDKKRQEELQTLGITFLRFRNEEIYEDLNGVIENIKLKVIDLLKNPPTPLPHNGMKHFVKGGHEHYTSKGPHFPHKTSLSAQFYSIILFDNPFTFR